MRPDRWHTRDRPVLLEIAKRLDEGATSVDSHQVAKALSLDDLETARVCDDLADEYIVGTPSRAAGYGTIVFVTRRLTSRGRREVGLWPSGENVEVLLDALRQAEELTEDPEEKGLIRRAAGALGMVSRDIMVDVMAAVIARQTGLTE
jgi:hypothetical protein